MELDRNSLEEFVQYCIGGLEAKNVVIKPEKKPAHGWWKAANEAVWEVFRQCFSERFPDEKPDDFLYAEGIHSIPPKYRGSFFGSRAYPDMALIGSEWAVAIELDHGNLGSHVRNALTKGSFNVLFAGFDQCLVLFFVELPRNRHDFTPESFIAEYEILDGFAQNLSTSVHFLNYSKA